MHKIHDDIYAFSQQVNELYKLTTYLIRNCNYISQIIKLKALKKKKQAQTFKL